MRFAGAQLDDLVAEIKAGHCIAFLGAGFSAPVCRGWGDLLAEVSGAASDPSVKTHVDALVARGTGRDYEVAAQLVEDAFAESPTSALLEAVRRSTKKPVVTPEERALMKRRSELLLGIPFAAILTTNFDEVLPGRVLDGDTYGELLREADRRWLEKRFWKRETIATPVLKLHGELRGDKGITLSRRGYRARLYAEPGYLNVLRSVFLTKTLLFVGFSFNDEYLNELRSEALAYIGRHASATPLAYAIVPDMPPAVCAHYAKHEGMHLFSYDSGPQRREHDAVDTLLEHLHQATNPLVIMGKRLDGKRILWVDPSDQNNARGRAHLADAARGLCTIDLAGSPDEAFARLPDGRYDLVITRWGHHPRAAPDAVVLLEKMRANDVRVPVVVFASGAFAGENRERALGLGALEYTSDWEALFEVIDRRFAPPPCLR